MEGIQENKHLLTNSRCNSIGCFLTIMQYLHYTKKIKHLLIGLNKRGRKFYDEKIKNSTLFNLINVADTNEIDIVMINTKTRVNALSLIRNTPKLHLKILL
jgi:hypothetical protein